MQSAIVTDEAEFPELCHEEIDALPRCTNHFREHLLRYFGKHFLRLGFLAVASQQQKSASQAFLAGVKELIDQIFLDSDVPGKNVRHEAVGEHMFSVKHAHHLPFFDDQDGRVCNRGGGPHPHTLTCQAPLTKEVAGPQYPDDCLFADLVNHGKLHAAILNVHHTC